MSEITPSAPGSWRKAGGVMERAFAAHKWRVDEDQRRAGIVSRIPARAGGGGVRKKLKKQITAGAFIIRIQPAAKKSGWTWQVHNQSDNCLLVSAVLDESTQKSAIAHAKMAIAGIELARKWEAEDQPAQEVQP